MGDDDAAPRWRERQTALVLGGTGMLAKASAGVADLGLRVLTPSRRGPASEGCEWFKLEWSQAATLRADLQQRSASPLALVVVWVHYPHRQRIWETIDDFVDEYSIIVELWSHRGARPEEVKRIATRPPHFHVVLGRGAGDRWLDHSEISTGALSIIKSAWRRENVSRVSLIGTLDAGAERALRQDLGDSELPR